MAPRRDIALSSMRTIAFFSVLLAVQSVSFASAASADGFSSLTAAQLAQLDPSVFSQASDADISSIPPEVRIRIRPNAVWFCRFTIFQACRGFTADQMRNLNASACIGFLGGQLALIEAGGFAGLQAECLFRLSNLSFLTPSQLSLLQPAAFKGLSHLSFKTIDPSVLSGVSAEQIANLRPSNNLTLGACAAISDRQLQAFPPSAFSGFTSDCVISTIPASWRGATWAGIQRLSDQSDGQNLGGCFGLTAEILLNILPSSCEGFMPNCIMAANTSWAVASTGLNFSSCTASIHPNSFGYASREAIESYPTGMFKFVTRAQVAAFSISACKGLSPMQLQMIDANSSGGFTSRCLSLLSPEAVGGLSHIQISRLSATSCAGFGSNFGGIGLLALWGLTLDQLRRLSPQAIASLTGNRLKALLEIPDMKKQLIQEHLWTATQLSTPNSENCRELKAVLPVASFDLPPPSDTESLEKMTWIYVALTRGDPFIAVNEQTQFASINPAAFSGIRADQIQLLPLDTISRLNANVTKFLLSDATGSFSKEQFERLSASALLGLTEEGWAGLAKCRDCAAALKPAQISEEMNWKLLPCAFIAKVSPPRLISSMTFAELQARRGVCGVQVLEFAQWDPVREKQVLFSSLSYPTFRSNLSK